MLNIFPWQTNYWQQLMMRKRENRLPHALMLTGISGLGKKQFSLELAKCLLCKASDDVCNECHACHLMNAGTHPDFMLVEPEKSGGMIKVDQVRELVQFVSETAFNSHLRVIIINPADAMNINAANALLKTLEEPAANVMIILIHHLKVPLPATILSRCQKILFQKPTPSQALKWVQDNVVLKEINPQLLLNLAEGSPLRAKEFAENGLFTIRQDLYQALRLLTEQKANPLQLAVQFQELDLQFLLNLIMIWLQDLTRFKLASHHAELINSDYQNTFNKISSTVSFEAIFKYLDHVKSVYANLLSALNLNRQLMLEELFIRWMQYATR